MVKELKNTEWKSFSKAEYAVIDCYGENCFACVLLEPVFDAAADELTGIDFGRVNITFEPDIADTFGIDSMPTLLFFRKGELVNRVIGSMESEDLISEISKLLYE